MTDHPGRAALAVIMEAMAKATPGPWKTHLVDDTSVINCDGNPVCETCAEGGVDADTDYELNWEEREATAAFIIAARNNIASVAACVADLEAERDKAKAENARLRKTVSKCAEAIGNGAYVSPEASVDFMELLPSEIALVCGAMASTTAAAVKAERERCAGLADQWSKTGDLLLRCGEMTAQELRTAKAVANGIAAAIRGDTP